MAKNKTPDTALTIVAAAALIRDNNLILMQRRPDASQHGGLWEFPGGKREAGETLTGCLARELTEELGTAVDPAAMALCASAIVPHHGGELLLVLFTARDWRGEPEARDGATIAWMPADDIRALPMPPGDIPLAAALRAQLAG